MHTSDATRRPPNDRNQGRKPIPAAMRKKMRTIYMTDADWEKAKELGGSPWILGAVLRAWRMKHWRAGKKERAAQPTAAVEPTHDAAPEPAEPTTAQSEPAPAPAVVEVVPKRDHWMGV